MVAHIGILSAGATTYGGRWEAEDVGSTRLFLF